MLVVGESRSISDDRAGPNLTPRSRRSAAGDHVCRGHPRPPERLLLPARTSRR